MHDDLRKIQHSNDLNVLPLITADTWSSVNMHRYIFWRFCSVNQPTAVFCNFLLVLLHVAFLPWVQHNSCKSSATHSYKGVVFLCVPIMVWLPVFGIFSACMHGDACNCTQGSVDTVTESMLEVDPGEKFFAAPGTRTHSSIVPGFLAKLSTHWTIPAPVL